MFIDYYDILDIDPKASQSEIKAAFKKQALRWHPDKNAGADTTQKMQKINEAYLILKDSEARKLFDAEYHRYQEFQTKQKQARRTEKQKRERYSETNNETQQETGNTKNQNDQTKNHQKQSKDTYEIYDETLKKWMQNARQQAVHLAKQTIDDIRGMSKESGQVMGNVIVHGTIRFLIFGLVMTIIVRACNT